MPIKTCPRYNALSETCLGKDYSKTETKCHTETEGAVKNPKDIKVSVSHSEGIFSGSFYAIH